MIYDKKIQYKIDKLAGQFKRKFPDIQLEDVGVGGEYQLLLDKTLESNRSQPDINFYNTPAFSFMLVSVILVGGVIGYNIYKKSK